MPNTKFEINPFEAKIIVSNLNQQNDGQDDSNIPPTIVEK